MCLKSCFLSESNDYNVIFWVGMGKQMKQMQGFLLIELPLKRSKAISGAALVSGWSEKNFYIMCSLFGVYFVSVFCHTFNRLLFYSLFSLSCVIGQYLLTSWNTKMWWLLCTTPWFAIVLLFCGWNHGLNCVEVSLSFYLYGCHTWSLVTDPRPYKTYHFIAPRKLIWSQYVVTRFIIFLSYNNESDDGTQKTTWLILDNTSIQCPPANNTAMFVRNARTMEQDAASNHGIWIGIVHQPLTITRHCYPLTLVEASSVTDLKTDPLELRYTSSFLSLFFSHTLSYFVKRCSIVSKCSMLACGMY